MVKLNTHDVEVSKSLKSKSESAKNVLCSLWPALSVDLIPVDVDLGIIRTYWGW